MERVVKLDYHGGKINNKNTTKLNNRILLLRTIFYIRITIKNISDYTVQLKKRHWYIFDSNGIKSEVEVDGVVGVQPILAPGQSYQYVSGCNIKGGYVLALPANKIIVNNALKALGGSLFDTEFCGLHTGTLKLCTNSVDCSVRSLWQIIQFTVDQLLDKVTLDDLVNSEKKSTKILNELLEQNNKAIG